MPRFRSLVALALVAAGCDAFAGGEGDVATTTGAPTTAPAPTTTAAPATTETEPRQLDLSAVETVAGGLEVPWALAFPSDGTILVTERPGRVSVVQGGEVRERPAATLERVVSQGEGGLLGIALHPRWPDERFAYLYYTAPSGNRVSRFAVADDLTFSSEEVIVDGIPSAAFHDGGRLAFGPDGLLYVTTGDAGNPLLAAQPGSLAGKVLRVAPDGSIPADNPFAGSPVWTYGHRNPQGLAWHGDGRLFSSEHGPTGEFGLCCHDEANVLEAGAFYGWPYVAGRVDARAGSPPEEPVAPAAASGGDTWAPAGTAIVGDTAYVALLAGERLLSFPITADGLGEPETALDGYGRLRAAVVGPDGCLYLTTSNTDGRGDPDERDDRILRAC